MASCAVSVRLKASSACKQRGINVNKWFHALPAPKSLLRAPPTRTSRTSRPYPAVPGSHIVDRNRRRVRRPLACARRPQRARRSRQPSCTTQHRDQCVHTMITWTRALTSHRTTSGRAHTTHRGRLQVCTAANSAGRPLAPGDAIGKNGPGGSGAVRCTAGTSPHATPDA